MMIDKLLMKHAGEFLRYLRNNQYEVSPGGVHFPKARATASGEYSFDSNGQNQGMASNLVPVQGLNYLLMTGLKRGAAQPNFYLALFSNAYTPVPGLTAASFAAQAGEIVSLTEGYTEVTRPEWLPADAAAGVIGNSDNRAAFTIATSAELTIRGAALLSDPVRGGTNGVLISAARFPTDRKEYAGSVFNLGYRVKLEDDS